MQSGFKDPTSIKNQRPKDSPKGPNKQWPWDWKCPQYDERSSCFINAGTHYGIGHKQPVGHNGEPKLRADTLPFGRVNTMRVDEAG